MGLLVLSLLVVIGITQYSSDDSSADPDGTYVGGGATYELYETDAGNTATANWDGTASEVTIEATVVYNEKTYFVNTLNQFIENSVVTKVTIKSNNQLTMGASTFYNNHALTTIELGEGIKELPVRFCAFSDLNGSSLTTINLDNVETIGGSAFQKCSKLASVDLSKAENIGAHAFDNCTSLSSIVFSPQLEILGDYAFQGCSNLQSIALPGAIISPGTGAFTRCAALNDVSFNQTFKSIGDHMFESCTGLTSIDLKNVQGIGASAFRNCTALVSITIPDTTKAIGGMAFDGCTSLTSCNLGSGLESLGKLVFQNCPITGKMVLPASITSITVMDTGIPTFPMGLSEIEVDPANQFFASRDGILYDKGFNTVLFCPREKTGEVTIAASVEEYAFAKCHLSKITILDGASTIGNTAFSAVEGEPTLEEIVFPNSLQSIGNYILKYQTNLKVIILPSNLGSLGGNLFNGLTGLEYVKFPDTSFTTTSVQSFNKVIFKLSDGTTVPKSTNGGTVSNLQGVRFVLNESAAATFNQIGDDQVLLTKVINGVVSYKAIQKGVPFESPEAPAAPEGLTFIGWFIDPEMTVAHSEENNIVADLTLYAKFRIDTCKVNLVVDNSLKDSISGLAPGSVVTLPTEVKDGQNFNGWMIGGTLLGAQYIVSVNDADENGIIALEASFSPIEKSSWNLTVTGDVNDKAFWTVTNAIGTYGMITVLPDEFETVKYTVSDNGGYGIISDNCAMVYSKDGNDVTVTVAFQEVGKASEYDVSVAEIASGEKHGFKATVTSKDGGYVDPAGEFAISYVYKTWNDTDKVWIYTTSGVTENVSNAIVKIPTDKKVSSFTGEFLLDNDSAMLVFGFATFSFKGTSVTGTEEDVTVHSPVIMCVSEIQAVVGKP
ncbi:leucine-rich repeat domain-containing protein [Methanomethylophilus alvi]|uniref:leucine-rich repeat domain-containing protein n=1 Tax=Methanomethylophilus alvi TaxID=1291540 RepID=UPI0037DD2C4D